MSSPQEYVYKMELVFSLMQETGKTRYTIEKVFDRLEAMGKIHPSRDPLDERKVRLPKEEVDILRQALA
jgi:DNA-binding MarR family transcriptional regulator